MKKANQVADTYRTLHEQMCQRFEQADGTGLFEKHPWEKPLGKGLTCVMRKGSVIEKAGLNFSHVNGTVTPEMEKIIGEKTGRYAATGISSIIHPYNPFLPVIHMNVRYFELDNGTAWFGGGIDLTPHYVDIMEAKQFHTALASICAKYNETFYPRFKTWADTYFFLPHRNETRGVGGIFFDRLQPDQPLSFEDLLAFTGELARAYPTLYHQRIQEKATHGFGDKEKLWQKLRRGRYAEFNLLYDRGTKFGIASGGNAESILISLPPEVVWDYDFQPAPGTAEWSTLELLKKDIDWLNYPL